MTAPSAPSMKMRVVTVDRCGEGDDCVAYRFETDRILDGLRVYFKLDRKAHVNGVVEFNLDIRETSATSDYFARSELNHEDGDELPGFLGVTQVPWVGGSMRGDRVQICSTSNPC